VELSSGDADKDMAQFQFVNPTIRQARFVDVPESGKMWEVDFGDGKKTYIGHKGFRECYKPVDLAAFDEMSLANQWADEQARKMKAK